MITIQVTRDELVNIVNDYEARLSLHEYEDGFNHPAGGCDAYHDVSVRDRALLSLVGRDYPCTCSERTKQTRATVNRLRAALDTVSE
jgi:hypothetical protein